MVAASRESCHKCTAKENIILVAELWQLGLSLIRILPGPMECGLTNPARAGRQQRQFALHPPWSPWHSPAPRVSGCRDHHLATNSGRNVSAIRHRMSYQVIARKYRPQRFRDVVGQEHV